jgi:hypothetical protein
MSVFHPFLDGEKDDLRGPHFVDRGGFFILSFGGQFAITPKGFLWTFGTKESPSTSKMR